MTLDRKIKKAAITVLLKHLLKGAEKSPERAARNIIELGCTTKKIEIETIEENLYYELLKLIEYKDEQTIINWFLNQFS